MDFCQIWFSILSPRLLCCDASFFLINPLTQFPLDKIATISQMTFLNTFSWMKNFVSLFEFHWGFFPRVQLTISQHWFRCLFGPCLVPSHYVNQCRPSSLMHNAALGGDELNASSVYIRDPNLVITVPADVLSPNGARPSAGTALPEKLHMSSFKFCWLIIILPHF